MPGQYGAASTQGRVEPVPLRLPNAPPRELSHAQERRRTIGQLTDTSGTIGIRLSGEKPASWTTWLDFLATGSEAVLKHPAFQLRADGEAYFQSTFWLGFMGTKFYIDSLETYIDFRGPIVSGIDDGWRGKIGSAGKGLGIHGPEVGSGPDLRLWFKEWGDTEAFGNWNFDTDPKISSVTLSGVKQPSASALFYQASGTGVHDHGWSTWALPTSAGSAGKFLAHNGTWQTPAGPGGATGTFIFKDLDGFTHTVVFTDGALDSWTTT